MDINEMIARLFQERKQIDQAINTLERLTMVHETRKRKEPAPNPSPSGRHRETTRIQKPLQ